MSKAVVRHNTLNALVERLMQLFNLAESSLAETADPDHNKILWMLIRDEVDQLDQKTLDRILRDIVTASIMERVHQKIQNT
ncbi:hypothetical protein KC571_03265 [candidate division WWE3 bacterium]|uniref:Uncharacterized protein n=1 Tax=candidate division WWE3 bacterium TaxID=2053526 RepID=A0A955RPM2_UNCKA|nr:hypothetical protein [candidate division WWE3 bacterium]